MKIKDFQLEIVDRLNGVEELVQHGCKAFAEDTRTVYNEAEKHVQDGRVSIVVVTPEFERDGASADGIPFGARVQVQCSEKPDVARVQQGGCTALDAAETVARELDGPTLWCLGIRQTIDRQARVLTATVTFATSVML